MAKRPSLADSLRASLSKGVHVDTAEKIARGLDPVDDDPAQPQETIVPVIVSNQVVSEPVVATPTILTHHPEQTTLPSDRITVKPSDHVTVSQSHGQTVLPHNGNTVVPFIRDTVQRLNGDTVKQSDSNTVTPSNRETVSLEKKQGSLNPHTVHQTVSGFIPLSVLNLPYNQACVLENLINNTSGVTNARTIADSTHITIPSVREALLRLIDKGFMQKPVTVRNTAFQGFSYVLNKSLCDHFITAGGLGRRNYDPPTVSHQTLYDTVSGSNSQTVPQYSGITAHSSSQSLEDLNTTTTSPPQTVLPSHGTTATQSVQGFILTGAVGIYWEEEGLGEGQAQKWCQQFETLPEQMRLQLEWARFDLENNGRRAEVKKDPVSWFFGHLRQTGGYFPRPVNYKSALELRAEALELQAKKDEEAKSLVAAADFESLFLKVISDPSSPQYQELFSQVSGFAKELFNDGDTSAVLIEMKELFKNRVLQ